jgi:hypothetical protein
MNIFSMSVVHFLDNALPEKLQIGSLCFDSTTHTSVKLHALANATKSSNLWKELVQSTYTLQHSHSRVTGEEKVNTWTQRGATAILQ